MNLYLFDIDGTLVNINNLHIDAYRKAYAQVLGIEVDAGVIISKFGMPDREMHELIFNELHIHDKEKIKEVDVLYLKTIKELVMRTTIRPLPGVVDCLCRLGDDVVNVLGIVTGNTEEMMNRILTSAGLRRYFSVFGFDDGKVKNRAEIVQNALNTAGRFEKVTVIGDTTLDIKAGKAVGAYTIAVATGSCSVKLLEKARPDLLVNDFRELCTILYKQPPKISPYVGK